MAKEPCPRCGCKTFVTFIGDERLEVCSKCGWPGEWLDDDAKDGTVVLFPERKHRYRRWKEPE